jgi:hypothetical protein
MDLHPRHAKDGQAFLEFTLSLVLLVAPGVLIGKLLITQWNHTKCLYLTFERTHAARAGQAAQSTTSISVTEADDSFQGQGQCGDAHEQVTLPKLEAAKW